MLSSPADRAVLHHAFAEKRFRVMRLAAWLFLALIQQITYFHRTAITVMADHLMAEFALSGVLLGHLAAAYAYMYLVMQIPGGVLVDRLGPRRIATAACLVMGAGSILFGLAPGSGLVFAGRLLVGLGGSLMLVNIFKFQSAWFRDRDFATMSGLAIFMGSSGALIAANPLAYLVGTVGWRITFVGLGLFTAALVFPCLALVRSTPREAGLVLPEGLAGSENSPPPASPASIFQGMARALSNRRLLPLFLINLGTYGGLIAFSGAWGVPWLMHVYGLTRQGAASFMLLVSLGYMLGSPVAGFISDRLRLRRAPIIAFLFAHTLAWGLLALWPAGCPPLALLYPVCFFLGFSCSGKILTYPIAREAGPPGATGSATATVNLGIFVGLAAMQPLFGYLLDRGWEGIIREGAKVYPASAYQAAFLICFAAVALALIASLFIKKEEKGPVSR